jgi:hypothetical protein
MKAFLQFYVASWLCELYFALSSFQSIIRSSSGWSRSKKTIHYFVANTSWRSFTCKPRQRSFVSFRMWQPAVWHSIPTSDTNLRHTSIQTRQLASLKHQYTSATVHGITTRKTVIVTVTAVRSSNFTRKRRFYSTTLLWRNWIKPVSQGGLLLVQILSHWLTVPVH